MRFFMTLVLILLLTGCAAGEGGAGSTTTQEEITAYEEETTVLQGGGNLRRPPESTLSYGGREVKGTLGSYCWTSGRKGVCADSIGPLIASKQEALTLPPDSEMVFRYGGQDPPKTVEAGAYSLNKPKNKKAGVVRPDRSLKAQGSGVQRTIPATLPPGEFVLEVSIEVNEQDGAAYYFRVMVE